MVINECIKPAMEKPNLFVATIYKIIDKKRFCWWDYYITMYYVIVVCCNFWILYKILRCCCCKRPDKKPKRITMQYIRCENLSKITTENEKAVVCDSKAKRADNSLESYMPSNMMRMTKQITPLGNSTSYVLYGTEDISHSVGKYRHINFDGRLYTIKILNHRVHDPIIKRQQYLDHSGKKCERYQRKSEIKTKKAKFQKNKHRLNKIKLYCCTLNEFEWESDIAHSGFLMMRNNLDPLSMSDMKKWCFMHGRYLKFWASKENYDTNQKPEETLDLRKCLYNYRSESVVANEPIVLEESKITTNVKYLLWAESDKEISDWNDCIKTYLNKLSVSLDTAKMKKLSIK